MFNEGGSIALLKKKWRREKVTNETVGNTLNYQVKGQTSKMGWQWEMIDLGRIWIRICGFPERTHESNQEHSINIIYI